MSFDRQPKPYFAVALLFGLLGGCGSGGDGTIAPVSVENGIVVADLDVDGLDDIVVARTYVDGPPPHAGFVDVYLQTAPGRFAGPVSYAIGTDPWNLAVGDIDGDNRADIVVANSSSGDVSILLQDDTAPGTFLDAQQVAVPGVPYAVAIDDFDDDGLADLAVALQNASGGAVVLRQTTLPGEPLEFSQLALLQNGTGALSVAAGDLDNDDLDDLPDVVVTGENGLTLFHNQGGVSFGSPVSLAAGIRPAAVVIADMNQDTRADLVVANAGNSRDGSGSSVSVLLQIAGGTFDRRDFPLSVAANGARHLAVGQLDGDTAPDIAVISIVYEAQRSSTLSVLQNPLSPTGLVTIERQGPFSGDFVAIGSIDEDGLNDIVVNDGPAVYRNLSGSFVFDSTLP
jgi:hypothetical protein